MPEQPPSDHQRRRVALMLLIKQWVDEYQVDEETCVSELATATAQIWYTAHHTLKQRLETWEATAAQIMQHTRHN